MLNRFLSSWTRSRTEFLDTGLKAVDLLAPLPINGTTLVTGDPRSGDATLHNELMFRFLHHPNRDCQVMQFYDQALSDLQTRVTETEELVPMLRNKHVVSQSMSKVIHYSLTSAVVGSIAFSAARWILEQSNSNCNFCPEMSTKTV